MSHTASDCARTSKVHLSRCLDNKKTVNIIAAKAHPPRANKKATAKLLGSKTVELSVRLQVVYSSKF